MAAYPHRTPSDFIGVRHSRTRPGPQKSRRNLLKGTGALSRNRLYTGAAGVVAQLGERRNRTAEVEGSTPFDSTKNFFVQPGDIGNSLTTW
jgi:hypothetical protein